MRLDHALDQVREAEAELARELRRVGERHAAESDVYHVAHLLAARSATLLDDVRPHAERHGLPSPQAEDDPPAVVERLRRMGSELLAGHEASGLLLLTDLRDLYLAAHRAELAWVVLLQGARAARDAALVATATEGREEAERRWKWIRTRIKEASPQVLVAG